MNEQIDERMNEDATKAQCFVPQGPEFQSMEGTLERKHRLQPGGKKVRGVVGGGTGRGQVQRGVGPVRGRSLVTRGEEPGEREGPI